MAIDYSRRKPPPPTLNRLQQSLAGTDPTTQTGPTQEPDWLQIALDHGKTGNVSQSNDAARKATAQLPDSPIAWHVRGLSSFHLDDNADAEFALGEAIRLDPNEASSHDDLGDVYLANEQAERALAEYSRAAKLDPGNAHYSASVGCAEAMLGNINKGHDLLKAAHEKQPDDDGIREMYAQVLLDMIVESWSTNEDAGTKLILSEKQLNYGKEKLAFIDTLGVTTIDDDVAIVRQDLEQAERVRFWSSKGFWLLIKWVTVGILLTVLGSFIEPAAMGGFALALVIGSAVLTYWYRIPGWKYNRRIASSHVRKTGLQ